VFPAAASGLCEVPQYGSFAKTCKLTGIGLVLAKDRRRWGRPSHGSWAAAVLVDPSPGAVRHRLHIHGIK